jgi:hypothetical protein
VSQNWITDNWRLPPATMNQWSFGIQRQMSRTTGLDVQYLGSHSYHLIGATSTTRRTIPVRRHQSAASESTVRPDPDHLERPDLELPSPGCFCASTADSRFQFDVSYTWAHRWM